MKKLWLGIIVVLCLGIFAKPLVCCGVKWWVLPESEGFDFRSVHLGREGAKMEGISMTLPLGKLYIDEFSIPFSKEGKKVMRGIEIQAQGFDPHPDLWFLKLGIDFQEGKIWFDHLKEPIFFSALDGVLRVSPDQESFPLLLSGEGYELKEVSLSWLSEFLKWPCQFSEGTLSGYYATEQNFDVTLTDFSFLWKEALVFAKKFEVNEKLQVYLEGGHLTYRGFDQDVQISQGEEGECCIQSGDFRALASLDSMGRVEGIIGDEVVFTWNGEEGMVRGTAIPPDLYGELLKLSGASCQVTGLIDLEAWYSQGRWTFDLTSYDASYLSSEIEVSTVGSISHRYIYEGGEWSGSFFIQEALVKIPEKEVVLQQVKGEFYLTSRGIEFKQGEAKLGELTLLGSLKLDFDEREGILSMNIDEIKGRLSDVSGLIPFTLPLEGDLTGTVYFKQHRWGGALHVEKGYGSQYDLRWEGVTCDIILGESIFFKNGTGNIILSGNNEPLSYRGILERCIWDREQGKGIFDIRFEKATYDILRMSGSFDRSQVILHPEHSHFFGAKIGECKGDYLEKSALFVMHISYADFVNQMEFLQGCGMLPQHDVRQYDIQGEAVLRLSYEKEHLQFTLQGEDILYAKREVTPFFLQGEITPQEIAIDKLYVNELSGRLLIASDDEGWSLTALELNYKGSSLKSNEGEWKLRKGGINLSSCIFNLVDFFPTWNGVISCTGPLQFDMSTGQGRASLMVMVDHFSEGDLSIKSQKSLEVIYTAERGFELSEVELKIRSGELWADLAVDKLKYHSTVEGEGVFLRLPPEMCLHLAEAGLIPCGRDGHSLIISGVPLKWENQIEAKGSFQYDKRLSMQGEMKDAYYWIGDRSWLLQRVKFGLEDHAFHVSFKTDYQTSPAYVQASLTFDPQFALEIALSDQKGRTLKLSGHHHQWIQKIEGEIWGLSANFHHNGKGGLIGLLKVNLSELLEVLPQDWKEKLEPLEIGSGYEITGEIVLAKDFQFDGHLKGREFQLFGSRLKSLMGTLHIDRSIFHLTDLRLSDEALTLSIPDLCIHHELGKWKLVIPEVMLQDFRPSLLRKVRKYRGRMKPFIIRELKFEHIEGILGEKESFIGHGALYFTNTFKTEVHFFDIPFEIIARIGLDPRLLVPVKGTLDFEMRNGKIFLTELKHAHSEGKCSKFYLSQTRPSFITLDGQIDISIKMRQYVILKVTEPFILSIQGSINQPKYSLR
ncbi:MAG: hypothetical protein KBC64_04785 [Simkaniaceae bacterium]|nr:hypothetical protein [Simkaniaceae bacterium]